MQKRMHSREFKLDVVRQIATGQKRPAQVCREYGVAESVLSRWRKEYQERGEAAFSRHSPRVDNPRATDSRVRALLRTTGAREPSGKKSVAEHGNAERHVMITRSHYAACGVVIERLCELFNVSRSWYYERAGSQKARGRDRLT